MELSLPEGSCDVAFSNWLLMYLGDAEVAQLARNMLGWVRAWQTVATAGCCGLLHGCRCGWLLNLPACAAGDDGVVCCVQCQPRTAALAAPPSLQTHTHTCAHAHAHTCTHIFCLPALALSLLLQVVEGGTVFFRESCFRQSGDKARKNNPTHYR